MPNEVLDVNDMLLMRLCCKENGGAPGGSAQMDPTVVQEHLDVCHNHGAFVRSIVGLMATNEGRRAASVNTKFESKDGVAHAF
jgi:hypothetical protein